MFVIIAIIIGLIIGLIRKGSVGNLWANKPKLWFLGLISGLIQLFLHLSFYFAGGMPLGMIATVLNFLSYILVLIMLVFNLDNMWSIIFAVGVTVCFVVTFINGGFMPVSEAVVNTLGENALAQSITNETNSIFGLIVADMTTLSFLGNYIAIPFVGKITSLYGAVPSISVGSGLILVALIGWIQSVMVKGKNVIVESVDDTAPEKSKKKKKKKSNKTNIFDMDDDEDEGIFGDKAFTESLFTEKEAEIIAAIADEDFTSTEVISEDELKVELDHFEKEIQADKTSDAEGDTVNIPDLKSDIFDEIKAEAKRNLLKEEGAEEKKSTTKVFNNVGLFSTEVYSVSLAEPEQPLDDSPMTSDTEPEIQPLSDDEQRLNTLRSESGFFTQLFHSEKDDLDVEEEEWDPASSFFVKSSVGKPVSFDEDETDTFFDESVIPQIDVDSVVFEEDDVDREPEKTQTETHRGWINPQEEKIHGEDNSAEEPVIKKYNWIDPNMNKKQKRAEQNNSRNSFVTDKTDESKVRNVSVSETQMLNVWRQVSDDLNKNKHYAKTYDDDANPFRMDAEARQREIEAQKQREAVEKATNEKREALLRRWDEYKENTFDKKKEIPVDQMSLLRSAQADKESKTTSNDKNFNRAGWLDIKEDVQDKNTFASDKSRELAEDLEKQRQGFEKVQIEIDGRIVSFWQRKK